MVVNGQPRNGLGRLNADGSLDDGFNPAVGSPWCMALQGDGKILVSFQVGSPTYPRKIIPSSNYGTNGTNVSVALAINFSTNKFYMLRTNNIPPPPPIP